MDLLYSRYTSPFEFMNLYMNQGRFGEFVTEIYEMEFKRKKQEEEKENDNRLWSLYIRSMSDKTFLEWKRDLIVPALDRKSGSSEISESNAITQDEIEAMIQKSQNILNNFVPN